MVDNGWKRPLFAAGLVAVIATAAALILPPLWAVIVGAAPPALLCIRSLRRRGALAIVIAAILLLFTATYRMVLVRPLERLDGSTDVIAGRVAEVPQQGTMVTIVVTDASLLPAGTRVGLYCPDSVMPRVGDRLTAKVELSRLTYSTASRYAGGVYLYAFPLERGDEPLTDRETVSLLGRLRDRLTRALTDTLPATESGVLSALCLGRGDAAPDTVTDAFRRSGLSHLLVVSGLHLSLVALAVWGLLRRAGLGLRLSAALTIPVILLFAVLMGATPSVCRAAVMCLVWLAGFLLRRRSDGLNSLGLAAILILLYNPYTLLSAGAQLSFLATAGVLILTPRLCRPLHRLPEVNGLWQTAWRKVWTYAYTAVAACVAALLFTLPIACYYFGGFGLLSVLSNLLAVGPAGVALGLGWMGMLCCLTPLLSWLGRPLSLAAGYLARYLTAVANFCGPEAAYLRVESGWLLALLGGLCLLTGCLICIPTSRRRLAVGMLTLTVLALAVGVPLSRNVTTLTVYPTEDGVALLVRQGQRAALVVTDSQALKSLRYDLGDRPLDAVFVSEGEPKDLPYLMAMSDSDTALYTDSDFWTAGLSRPVTEMGEEPVSLWEGCTLTPLPDGGWRLDTPAAPLMVDAACEGVLSVRDDLPETHPNTYTVAVVTTKELAKSRPTTPDELLILTETEEPVTFVAREGGEWSVLPWL